MRGHGFLLDVQLVRLARIVAVDGSIDVLGIEAARGQPFCYQCSQAVERDAVCRVGLRIEPVRQCHEIGKRRVRENQCERMREASGVGHQIPVTRKAHEALHVGKIDAVRGQDRVRRMRVELQAEGVGVPNDGRAAQALQDAELDFMRLQGMQLVEAGSEAGDVFTGQAGDQVDMQMRL